MNHQSPRTSIRVAKRDSRRVELLRHKLIEEAQGWLYFGNCRKAEEALNGIPKSSGFYRLVQVILLNMDLDLGRFQEGSERGDRINRTIGHDEHSVKIAINCLIHQGKPQEAWQLARLCEEQWLKDPSGSYTLARIESKLGNFTASLRWLRCSLQLSSRYAIFAFFDPHLSALWRHLGRLRAGFDNELLGILASPVFERHIKKAERERDFLGMWSR